MVVCFLDTPTPPSPEYAQLFEDYGLEAWLIIACLEREKQIEEENAIWDRFKALRDDPDDDTDTSIDMGPEEPDTY